VTDRPLIPLLALLALAACADDAGFRAVDRAEQLPGGDTTNRFLLGPNAFLRPAANLDRGDLQAFYGGNGFFNQSWVVAPASTMARDGLGPLFNARTCSGCHFRDAKARPPEDGLGPFVGLLFRIQTMGPGGPSPHPVYGAQLQDQAMRGVPAEVVPRVTWEYTTAMYADGTPYTLRRPSFSFEDPGYGPLGEDLMVSARIAPHMVGLGLLEAIPTGRLEELADPDDLDGDGISGRINYVDSDEGLVAGRFGWRAESPTIIHQSASAFLGDMGLTSREAPRDDCTSSQAECRTAPNGGDPEVSDFILERVAHYSASIAVPVRRSATEPAILEGRQLFRAIGCDGCHTPSHQTGESVINALEDQLIWPYTDLLLHDMGPGLADLGSSTLESAREWRTPPLWGVGLMPNVAGHSSYLHDGRAQNTAEAILWHGGEAETSRNAFLAMSAPERDALVQYIEDL